MFRALAFVVGFVAFTLASVATAEQIVFLNFGSPDDAAEKDDQSICDEDGGTIITMKKGPRVGFRPTDLGFDNNNDLDACVQSIVDQVTADYADLNITFVTEEPAEGEFTTINIVTGNFPDYNFMLGDTTYEVDISAGRLRLGDTGFFLDLDTNKVVDQNGELVKGNDGPICFQDLNIPTFQNVLGIAQEIDEGNANANKAAWVFVSAHGIGTAQQNKTELGNTISHELAHLLGLEHDDGEKGSLMGETNLTNYGDDKDFTMGGDDPDDPNSRRKLEATLPEKVDSEPRTRSTKTGDRDQHGTGESAPPTGDPIEDATNDAKAVRQIQEPHVLPRGRTLVIDPMDVFPSPSDPPFTDIPLENGANAFFDLPLSAPGVIPDFLDAWLEIQIANLNDTSPTNDTRVFVDGMELIGAFDGVDQTTIIPPPLVASQRLTLFLPDYLSVQQIEDVLADGLVQVDILVGGATPFVSIDNVKFTVTDNFSPSLECPGDCNGDGMVNFADLTAMLFAFGSPTAPSGCDANGDGVINFNDLTSALFIFGPCP